MLAALVATLAGCGNSRQRPSVQPRSSTTAATSPDESSKPPAQILADAAAALDRQHTFHVRMTGRIPSVGGSALLTADVVLPGRIRLTLATGRKRADAIVVGNGAYFKANAEFWRGQVPARLRSRIANRWIGLPGNALAGFASILSVTNPALAGRCTLLSHVGVLSSGGIATVGGRRVLVIVDRGRIPGATPSKIYIAASGPPLPMREIQTGPQVPGGTPNRTCGETKSDVHDKSSRQRLSIGHYNAPVTITAPANVLNVQPPSSTTQA